MDRRNFLLLLAFSVSYLSYARASSEDYEFRAIEPKIIVSTDAELAVQVFDKRKGKPVSGAEILKAQIKFIQSKEGSSSTEADLDDVGIASNMSMFGEAGKLIDESLPTMSPDAAARIKNLLRSVQIQPVQSSKKEEYHFRADVGKPGQWALNISLKLPRDEKVIQGRVVFTAVDPN